MESLRKMSKAQPHLPWLIGSALVSLIILVVVVSAAMGETPQVEAPPLLASDWVLIIAGALAVPATMLAYWALQFLSQPQPRLQDEAQEVRPRHHIIVNTPNAKPEVVLRLTQERDEWKRAHDELQQKYARAQQVQIVQPVVEPERELTYAAVLALVKTGGRVSINEAQKLIRGNRGMVGRDYRPLQEVLMAIAALSPTAPSAPIRESKQAVHEVNEGVHKHVNGEVGNRRARLPRKKRGW